MKSIFLLPAALLVVACGADKVEAPEPTNAVVYVPADEAAPPRCPVRVPDCNVHHK